MDDFIYLRDVFAFLRRYFLLILLIAVFVAAAAFGASFFIPKSYETEITGFLPQKNSLAMPQGSQGTAFGMIETVQPKSFVMLLLNSQSLKLRVIKALDLGRDRFFTGGATNLSEENLADKLEEMLIIIQLTGEEFKIIVKGPEPDLVLNIANEMVKQMRIILKEKRKSDSLILKQQVKAVDKSLRMDEEKLGEYESAHKDTFLSRKTTGQIDTYVELRKKLFLLDAKLSRLSGMNQAQGNIEALSYINKNISALGAERKALLKKLNEMELQNKRLPGSELELLRLKRQADVDESLLIMLNGQYVMALVSEDKAGNMDIVDPPFRPRIHSYPSKKVIVIAAAFFGVLFGIFASYIINVSRMRKIEAQAA